MPNITFYNYSIHAWDVYESSHFIESNAFSLQSPAVVFGAWVAGICACLLVFAIIRGFKK